MSLKAAVGKAVEWAEADDASAHAAALAELAKSLAGEIEHAPDVVLEKPPPYAQLAKELRATLEELEAMRDGDDAQASIGVVLSTPVWDAAG